MRETTQGRADDTSPDGSMVAKLRVTGGDAWASRGWKGAVDENMYIFVYARFQPYEFGRLYLN
jgi:hypothetical protein